GWPARGRTDDPLEWRRRGRKQVCCRWRWRWQNANLELRHNHVDKCRDTAFAGLDLYDIHFGSRFTVVGASGAIINSTTTNSVTIWNAATTQLGADDLPSILFDKGVYLAVGANVAHGFSL
ncbi:MAG: hypothetical protein ABIP64_00760, partial [Burkholderiales bacterium]